MRFAYAAAYGAVSNLGAWLALDTINWWEEPRVFIAYAVVGLGFALGHGCQRWHT